MKHILVTFGLLITVSLQLSGQAAADESSTEPKTALEITINGKKYQVAEGAVLKLDSTLVKPAITVRISDRKKLDNSAVSFDYPRHLSFEFEKDTNYKSWTLSGNNLVVTLFELGGKVEMQEIVDGMVGKFGKQNCTVEDFRDQLGSVNMPGKKIHVNLAGSKILISFYQISATEQATRLISFQDTIQDDGSPSDEFKKGFDMINRSIHFRP